MCGLYWPRQERPETEQRKAGRERNLFSLVGPGARLLVLVVE
jgi:hypothetical protein